MEQSFGMANFKDFIFPSCDYIYSSTNYQKCSVGKFKILAVMVRKTKVQKTFAQHRKFTTKS